MGLCVLALAAERGVHFDAAGHLAMSAKDWFEVGCGALTAFVSGVSQDAEKVSCQRKGCENTDADPSMNKQTERSEM